MGALRTHRDRAMVQAMVLGGLRRCEVLGLRLGDLRLGEWRVLITEGKGGHERLVPLSPTFFATVARYLNDERPSESTSDSVFVSLKGSHRGQPLSTPGLDEIVRAARKRAGLSHGTCHELRHTCFTRLREAGMAIEAIQAQAGHRSSPRPGSTYTWAWTGWLTNTDGLSKPSRLRLWWGWPNERPGPPICPETRRPGGGTPEVTWTEIANRAPRMAATMASYLDQLKVSSRPNTVSAVDLALRLFAHRVTAADPTCVAVADIGRPHIEDFSAGKRPVREGRQAAIDHHHPAPARLLRTFFERFIEWDYDDAPARLTSTQRLSRSRRTIAPVLDDLTAAKFIAALATDPNRRRRLMVELLARTGMRVGELASLTDDAMVSLGGIHQLRIPVGKLHNDRYIPLLPMLIDLIVDYRAWRGPSRSGYLVERDDGKPFDRRTVQRYVATVAKPARSATSIPTSCATHWLPSPSTGA